ncbi:MAG: replicative DNA helicase [Ruminococcus sp.]|nr:replicative DNA helicase [Ruminococcus sp.]MCM1381107.1 replicative DNA helicase [Muribaculaceae bacterium]MCM1479434.1 replicative DNA helicase [Muribaculaceae bacterium]
MDFDLNSTELPYNLEAEQTVLGALLLDPETLSEAMNYIKPDSFYITKHRDLFAIIIRQFTLGVKTDIITVIDEAVRDGVFESSSAAKEYLAALMESVPTTKNIESYCKIVEQKFYIRQLITTAKEIIEVSTAGQENAEQLLDFAEQKIYDIRQGKAADGLTKIDEVVLEAYDELGRKSGPDKEKYLGAKSGFSDLDHVITGLNKSDLIILAARPAMGKSAFALNLATNVARRNRDAEVVIFSLEMSKEQNVIRMLESESLVEGDCLMKGNISGEQWTKLAEGAERLSGMNIYLDDTAGITVPQMKAKLRRMKNLGLVIIDYLQLMSSSRRIENRVTEISEITRQLKLMAKELNVPVITLSQLSRAVESRTDKRPMLSDLRESGSIEQDADIVMFLYRDAYYNKDTQDPSLAECIVAKNRHGETGSVNLRYNAPYMLFVGTTNAPAAPPR